MILVLLICHTPILCAYFTRSRCGRSAIIQGDHCVYHHPNAADFASRYHCHIGFLSRDPTFSITMFSPAGIIIYKGMFIGHGCIQGTRLIVAFAPTLKMMICIALGYLITKRGAFPPQFAKGVGFISLVSSTCQSEVRADNRMSVYLL